MSQLCLVPVGYTVSFKSLVSVSVKPSDAVSYAKQMAVKNQTKLSMMSVTLNTKTNCILNVFSKTGVISLNNL